jgi:hypothetical protein
MHPGSQQWIMRLLSVIIVEKVERDGEKCDKTQEVGRSEEKSDGW